MPDDFDSLVARRFHVLDDVSIPETWSRVQLKLLDRAPVDDAKEGLTMIDLDAPSTDDLHQKRRRRHQVAALLAAAAAIVAIALVVARDTDDTTPVDQPSTTVTVPASPPQALFGTPNEPYAPGTYFVDEFAGTATPRISITLGDGWTNVGTWYVVKEGTNGAVDLTSSGAVTITQPTRVYDDACHWSDGSREVSSLDDVVAALTEQGGWVDVSPPSDAPVDGYAGKTFQRTAQASFAECDQYADLGTQFRSWGDVLGNPYYVSLPGDIDTLRVIDLNGTIVVIDARLQPDHEDSTAVAAELAAMLESVRIEPT